MDRKKVVIGRKKVVMDGKKVVMGRKKVVMIPLGHRSYASNLKGARYVRLSILA